MDELSDAQKKRGVGKVRFKYKFQHVNCGLFLWNAGAAGVSGHQTELAQEMLFSLANNRASVIRESYTMIALLTGKIAYKAPDFIVLDVNGVGYQVQVPLSTYYVLLDEGKTISLQIYTHVKVDSINLYGFGTLQEKDFFQLLIGVSGIGPKLAINILSNSELPELAESLVSGNLARLSAIPGIGKRTAERLVLELKEKVKKLGMEPPTTTAMQTVAKQEIREDVLSALINLGYKEAAVQKALGAIIVAEDATVETILRQALKVLMK